MIYAKRNSDYTKFTEMAWRLMRKDKGGWKQITEAEYKKSNIPKSSEDDAKVKVNADLDAAIIARAKASAEEGNYEKAIDLLKGVSKADNGESDWYKEAISGYLNKINEKEKALKAKAAKKEKKEQYDELIAGAELLIQGEEYDDALALLSEAKGISNTQAVNKRIGEIKKMITNESKK